MEMVIVAGAIEVAPEERAAFLASREEVMGRSRREPGCLEYTFSADPLEPGRVVLFERWEDQAALDAHVAGLRAAPSPAETIVPRATSIALYDVAGIRALGG